MYKLIALDMDGTLFTSDKKITDRTKKAIAMAHAKGVKIVLASGRPLDGLHKPLAELNLISDDEYVLCYNGALAVTAKSGTILSQCTLTGADCSYAEMTYCNFTDADMAGCVLCECDLSNSDLSASYNLHASRYDSDTVWPDNDMMPEDFEANYSDDLSSLKDEEDNQVSDY